MESLGGGRFRVSGTLDAVTVGELLKQSKERFANEQQIDIDFAGVSDADSSGLALLIEWLRMAKDASSTIHFSNVPGQIAALARISEVDDLLFGSTPSAAAAATA